MEAGLQYGQAISGLDDVNEMSRLSDEYKDHAYYFATRASEIHFKQTNKAAEISISDEITSIQDEINRINSDKKFLELLDANAEICEMVRNQNPNNKDYIFD
jgi:YHS domain-containing protein